MSATCRSDQRDGHIGPIVYLPAYRGMGCSVCGRLVWPDLIAAAVGR